MHRQPRLSAVLSAVRRRAHLPPVPRAQPRRVRPGRARLLPDSVDRVRLARGLATTRSARRPPAWALLLPPVQVSTGPSALTGPSAPTGRTVATAAPGPVASPVLAATVARVQVGTVARVPPATVARVPVDRAATPTVQARAVATAVPVQAVRVQAVRVQAR
jgi:hypothetical protein